ncbi:MAG TPA: glycoside hydrolase family 3 N-terminal domain-containing protein [Methylomirabilota bacterium]|nr:glycoside hydrolase family 3 N-terminal domain-containing protein [Methylomirabilota bacterium]
MAAQTEERNKAIAALIRLLAVALLLAACTTSARPSPTPSATESPTPIATASPTPSPTATAECAVRVLASMTLEQRIGQLFLLGLANDQLGAAETNAIRTYHFGSVWFVEQSAAGAPAIRAVADAVQTLATPDTTAGIRFFVAANQEGGIIQSLKGPGFSTIPSALDQSAIDPATLQTSAALWGRELASAGVNLNFAPVLDVVPPGTDAQNEPIGVLKRGYGHDPATVSAHALAFIRGMDAAGIATTGKHFPGLGRVAGNTDFTAAVVDDVTTPTDPYLAPFRDAITAGIPMVMVALAKYQKIDPNELAVFSTPVMRNLLRDSLNFTGVVVSDDLGATAAVANIAPADRAVNFLSAGGDFIISKTIAPANAMAAAISAQASGGDAFKTRVDDAALRVLRLKVARGLVRC